MMRSDDIMVCVTQQKTCERLIHYGRLLRDKLNGQLHVVHVVGEGINFLGNAKEPEALEYLFNISKKAGADLTVLRSRDIGETLYEFVKKNDVSHIVLGENANESSDSGIIGELKNKLQECQFHIISQDDNSW